MTDEMRASAFTVRRQISIAAGRGALAALAAFAASSGCGGPPPDVGSDPEARRASLSATDCSAQGGDCDASNTCVKFVPSPGGFLEEVLGSCEAGGGSIGGGGDPGGGGGGGSLSHVVFKTATARGKTASFDAITNGATLNLTKADCTGQFTLAVKFSLINSKKCCFDDRSFVHLGSAATLKIDGYEFFDYTTSGEADAVLEGPATGAKGTATVRVFGVGTFGDTYTADGSVKVSCL